MVNTAPAMQDNEDEALRDVEHAQQQLKQHIADSDRLIGRAQDAIRRFRETQDGEAAEG